MALKTFSQYGRDLKRKVGHSLGPVRRGVALTVVAGKYAGAETDQERHNLKKFAKRLVKKDPPKFRNS